MASDRPERTASVGFKTVELFKDQTLGIGSYGKVCKAKCDDLLCAAKLIHETLFDPTAHQLMAPQREHRLPMRRFEQECDFLSTIRHPNIVQYLGIYRDSDTGLPALLMELMDDSLTHFVESSTQPIPYHIQVNICHDITLALSFLHSNSIVHRDLSSNNVLLIGNAIRAKVTDFGMASLGDQNPRATQLTFTMCPGTDVYMPPEAVQDKPVYTEKIDCFSFGVITLQILTRQFPNPGDRRRKIEIIHPGLPSGTMAEVLVPETERRQNHISIIDPNHTLLQVTLDCLKGRDVKRPSAQQLCERVAVLKESPEYNESVMAVEERNTTRQALREKDEAIAAGQQQIREQQDEISRLERENNEIMVEKERQLRDEIQQVEEKDRQEIQIREQRDEIGRLEREKNEIMVEKERQLRDEIQQVEREKNRVIEEKERQLGRMNQQLEECGQVIAQFQRRIAELEQLRPATDVTPRSKQQSSSRARIKMTWRKGRKAPCEMRSYYNAVVDGTALYVRHVNDVYAFTTSTSSWSQLPDSPTNSCPSVIVNNRLTLVGGYLGKNITNKILSLTGEGSCRRWTEELPPMPTKRNGSTALCTGTALIVAGGKGDRFTLQTVEVMNTETLQWSTAAHLPQPVSCAPGAVCGDCVYILSLKNHPKSVYTCPISALIQSCKSRPTADVWNKVAAPLVAWTTCVSILGRLLTIGGRDPNGTPTTTVYMYNPDSDSWNVISLMAKPRYLCFAAVLPNNQLMVVGGESDYDTTDSVELATVE